MTKLDEAALTRTVTLAAARRLCVAWAYWCWRTHARTGYEPFMSTGGIERFYRTPPQWDPPEPRLPDADENTGLAVQKAYIHLPERPYRLVLRAEFCARPWIIGLTEEEIESSIARRARVSIGAYDLTLERALLALVNVMKRKGLWRES